MILNKINLIYSSERDQTADLLKGFAVLMMIQVHLMELFAKPEISVSLTGRISLFLGGPPAAPLFMAVMGYFLAQSKKNFSQNFKRGLILIFGGILLNIGMNLHLLILNVLGKVQVDPLKYIFGADILPLAGFSIILIAGIKWISKNKFYAMAVISFLIIILILFLQNSTRQHAITNEKLIYLQAFLWGNIEWSYFPFLPWAIYSLIGFFYRIIIELFEIENAYKDLLAITCAVISFITISYGINSSSNLMNYYHHDWIFTLWIIQFLILLVYVLNKLEELYGKNAFLIYVKWIGKNVTAVYVFQWLLIGNIATMLYRTQNEIALIFWFLTIIILTSFTVYFFEKRHDNKTD